MVTLLMTLSDPKVPQTTPICTFCTASHIFVMGAVRNFKSGLYVNGSKSQPADDKSSLKWAWSGRVIHFRILYPLKYFWNDNSSRLQILYTSWPREVLSFSWLTVPEVGMVRITWHILDFFYTIWSVSATVTARLPISYTSWPREILILWCLTIPQVGVVRITWPMSTFWGPGYIFGADENRHFKFGLHIELKKYWNYTC